MHALERSLWLSVSFAGRRHSLPSTAPCPTRGHVHSAGQKQTKHSELRCLPLATWKANMVTMNTEEGWTKPLHCGLGLFSSIHPGARIIHVCQRELTVLPPSLFYPFLPICISTHPQSEDERQVHTHSTYFSPDLGVLLTLLRIWLSSVSGSGSEVRSWAFLHI